MWIMPNKFKFAVIFQSWNFDTRIICDTATQANHFILISFNQRHAYPNKTIAWVKFPEKTWRSFARKENYDEWAFKFIVDYLKKAFRFLVNFHNFIGLGRTNVVRVWKHEYGFCIKLNFNVLFEMFPWKLLCNLL